MLTKELIDTFNRYFTIRLAVTEEERKEAYALRYQVYIEEFGFDNPTHFKECLEVDEYDEYATTCLIYHNTSKSLAACVRMVQGASYTQLPTEKFILGSIFDKATLQALKDHHGLWGEVSRLAVAKQFRRRPRELFTPSGYYEEEDKRTYPLLSIVCFLSCIVMTELNGIEHCIASMEPFLARLIRRSHLEFQDIGNLVEYHGQRKTYAIHRQQVLDTMDENMKLLVDNIYQDFTNQLLVIF